MIDKLMANIFIYGKKHNYKMLYDYSWNGILFKLKRRGDSKSIIRKDIKGNFNLIVYMLDDFGLVREYKNPGLTRMSDGIKKYVDLKNILINTVKNGNTFNYKYHIYDDGIKIWKDSDIYYTFEEGWWENFIIKVFGSFNIRRIK
jgi:hypothetical protein